MSGSNDYTYNRFDAFEAKLKAQKEEEVAASEEEEVIEEGKSERPLGAMHSFARGVKQERGAKKDEGGKYLRQQNVKKQNKKEADLDAHREKQRNERGLPESAVDAYASMLDENRRAARDPEGYARQQAAEKDAPKASGVRNSVSDKGRDYAVTGTPERSKASERRKDRRVVAGYGKGGMEMAIDRAKKERDANREARRMRKEELEATGLFTVEEIESLLDLTEKCDDCDDKKKEKKSKKSGGAKPDYIDADGDGDKEESMKKALEDKEGGMSEDYDPMEDDDFDPVEAEANRGVSGKNNPKGGKKTSLKKLAKNVKEELSIDDQMRISRDAAKGRNPNPDHKAIRAKQMKDSKAPKDKRTDAQKMADAYASVRKGPGGERRAD